MNKSKKNAVNAALKHDPKMRADSAAAPSDSTAWYSPWGAPFKIYGMGWRFADNSFRRMPPVSSEMPLPKSVDDLAWHTSGIQVRFRTDALKICVRVKLRGPHSMDHMPSTGQCGIDAYIGEVGSMTFAGITRFNRANDSYEVTLCNFPSKARRTITLNLPLYQGVEELMIGVPEGDRVSSAARPACKRPVVVYGTSITQGGCASRPGMAYTNILSRRLDCEFINLGFSGSGRGEPEVARAIASLKAPRLFVMDYEANACGLEKMKETLSPFLATLREKWADTEILVVSKVPYAQEAWNDNLRLDRLAQRDYQRRTVARLRRESDENISFFDGSRLLGRGYTECSVDGVHQTDLGFLRMADKLEPVIRKLLEKK